MEYYVSMENRIGQVSITTFDSKEAFDEFYVGRMRGGTNDLIKNVYPIIHYQGTDEAKCDKITERKFREWHSNPSAAHIQFLAENGELEAAIELHEKTKVKR